MTENPEPTDVEGLPVEFHYDLDDADGPVVAVVEAVARVKGVEKTALRPVAEAIDPDALIELVRSDPAAGDFYRTSSRKQAGGPWLTFRYEGLRVTVSPDRIRIEG